MDGICLAQQTLDALTSAVGTRHSRGAAFTCLSNVTFAVRRNGVTAGSDSTSSVAAVVDPTWEWDAEAVHRYAADAHQRMIVSAQPSRQRRLEAHVFQVAADAYRDAVADSKGSTIVVAGESGSGKTECVRSLLRFLGVVAGQAQPTGVPSVNEALRLMTQTNVRCAQDAHDILHLLSSAPTHHSLQSSRGGIIVKLSVARSGCVVAADINAALIDKWRVTAAHVAAGSGAFSILQCLRYGSPPDISAALGLEALAALLPPGIPAGAEEEERFRHAHISNFFQLVSALVRLGFHEGAQMEMFKLLAATVLLCELPFPCPTDFTSLSSMLAVPAALLQVPVEALVSAVITAAATSPISRGTGATSRAATRRMSRLSGAPQAKSVFNQLPYRTQAVVTGLGLALYNRVWLYMCASVRYRLHAVAEQAMVAARRVILHDMHADRSQPNTMATLERLLAPAGWVGILDGPGSLPPNVGSDSHTYVQLPVHAGKQGRHPLHCKAVSAAASTMAAPAASLQPLALAAEVYESPLTGAIPSLGPHSSVRYETGDLLCSYFAEKLQQLQYQFLIANHISTLASEGHEHPTLYLAPEVADMTGSAEQAANQASTLPHKISVPSPFAILAAYHGAAGVPTTLFKASEELAHVLHPDAGNAGFLAGMAFAPATGSSVRSNSHTGITSATSAVAGSGASAPANTPSLLDCEPLGERVVGMLATKLERTSRVTTARHMSSGDRGTSPGGTSEESAAPEAAVCLLHSHSPVVYSPRGFATMLACSLGCEAALLRGGTPLPHESFQAAGADLPLRWGPVPACITTALARSTASTLLKLLLPHVVEARGTPLPYTAAAVPPPGGGTTLATGISDDTPSERLRTHSCENASRCLMESIDALLSELVQEPRGSPIFPAPPTAELALHFIRCVNPFELQARHTQPAPGGRSAAYNEFSVARQLVAGYGVHVMHLNLMFIPDKLPWEDFFNEYIVLFPDLARGVGSQLQPGISGFMPTAALLHRLVHAYGDSRRWKWPEAYQRDFEPLEGRLQLRVGEDGKYDAFLGNTVVFISATLRERASRARVKLFAAMDAAAKTLARWFRAVAVRLRYCRFRTACIRLQAVHKARRQRVKFAAVVAAQLRLSRFIKTRVARNAYLAGVRAVTSLQRRLRRWRIGSHASALSASLFRLHALGRAALLRQRIYRIHWASDCISEFLRSCIYRARLGQLQLASATAIQASWRGAGSRRAHAAATATVRRFRLKLYRRRLFAICVANRKGAVQHTSYTNTRTATRFLQRWWRARALHTGFTRLRWGVRLMQRACRRFLLSCRISRVASEHERRVQASLISVILQAEGRSVLAIQATCGILSVPNVWPATGGGSPVAIAQPAPETAAVPGVISRAFNRFLPLDVDIISPLELTSAHEAMQVTRSLIVGRIEAELTAMGVSLRGLQAMRECMVCHLSNGNLLTLPWYTDSSITPKPAPVLRLNVAEVSAGWYHAVARLHNGSCVAWGKNASGQCGFPSDTGSSVASPTVIPGIRDIVQLAAGAQHTLLLTSYGSAFACGGELGTGRLEAPKPTHTSLLKPEVNTVVRRLVGLHHTHIVAIASGWYHNCAVDAKGAVYAWGDNRLSQCGVSSTYTAVPEPLRVDLEVSRGSDELDAPSGAGAVGAGVSDSSALHAMIARELTSEPVATARLATSRSAVTISAGVGVGVGPSSPRARERALVMGGLNKPGRAGFKHHDSGATRASIACGGQHTVVLLAGGSGDASGGSNCGAVWAWGSNMHGECGLESSHKVAAPHMLSLLSQESDTSSGGATVAACNSIPLQVAAGAHATYVLTRVPGTGRANATLSLLGVGKVGAAGVWRVMREGRVPYASSSSSESAAHASHKWEHLAGWQERTAEFPSKTAVLCASHTPNISLLYMAASDREGAVLSPGIAHTREYTMPLAPPAVSSGAYADASMQPGGYAYEWTPATIPVPRFCVDAATFHRVSSPE